VSRQKQRFLRNSLSPFAAEANDRLAPSTCPCDRGIASVLPFLRRGVLIPIHGGGPGRRGDGPDFRGKPAAQPCPLPLRRPAARWSRTGRSADAMAFVIVRICSSAQQAEAEQLDVGQDGENGTDARPVGRYRHEDQFFANKTRLIPAQQPGRPDRRNQDMHGVGSGNRFMTRRSAGPCSNPTGADRCRNLLLPKRVRGGSTQPR